MSNFSEQLPKWEKEGSQPPSNITDTDGWTSGDKPPANWLNWLFNKAYKCLVEIRNYVDGLAGVGRTTETVKGNADAITALNQTVTTHTADIVTDADGAHGLKIETGTFTPILSGDVVAGTQTYITQFGKYRKIGSRVWFDINIALSAKAADISGSVLITGLPFACLNLTNYRGFATIVYHSNLDLDATKPYPQAIIINNESFIRLRIAGDNVANTAMGVNLITATTSFLISGSYEV